MRGWPQTPFDASLPGYWGAWQMPHSLPIIGFHWWLEIHAFCRFGRWSGTRERWVWHGNSIWSLAANNTRGKGGILCLYRAHVNIFQISVFRKIRLTIFINGLCILRWICTIFIRTSSYDINTKYIRKPNYYCFMNFKYIVHNTKTTGAINFATNRNNNSNKNPERK